MKHAARIAFSAVVVACLHGCANAPRSHEGDLPIAVQYGLGDPDRNAPIATVHTNTAPGDARGSTDDAWWRRFGDPKLERLIERVLASNPNLAAAGFALERARAVAGLNRNALFPRAGASLDSTYSKPLDNGGSSTRSHFASAGVSYVVDLWGKLRLQRDMSAWEAQATAEDLHSTRLALVGTTANFYWQLAFLNRRIAVGEQTLANLERTRSLARSQYDAGAVSRLELLEAEQALQAQRAMQSEFAQLRVEVRNSLAVLLGGEPWSDEPQDIVLARGVDIEPGLPADLLRARPDLRAAELRLRSSLANVDVVERSFYPSLTLTGTVGGASDELRNVLENPLATLGAGLILPFMRWQEVSLNTRIASAGYEIAVNEFRTALYTAFKEVDDALSARAQLVTQLQAREASHAAAMRATRLYEVRYRAGAVPLRAWLDAQERERVAELALAQTRLEQLQNDVLLLQALGGA